MKIGLFTDAHYCKARVLCGTRRPSLSPAKIREAMNVFREAGTDMCICLGDMTDHAPEDTHDDCLANLRELIALIGEYDIPFYLVPGNHDYLMMTGDDIKASGLLLPPYTIDTPSCRLIVLDANYRSDMRRFDEAGVDWTDANLPPEQIAYLKEQLSSAVMPCVVLVHENLDPNVECRHIIKNAAEVRQIIAESGKVKLVLQGHYHPGAENTIDGIRYLTLPAMCEGEENRYLLLEMD